jgi:DNA repair ATPase RecN
MSILEAVILLARVVKQVADDSSSNATTVHSLAARVESMVRVLQKIPENTELDPGLLNRMHDNLKEAHRLIVKYDKKGTVLRLISASSMKSKLGAVEASIGRCIDDLSFNVGMTSAAVLEGIRADLREAAERDGM